MESPANLFRDQTTRTHCLNNVVAMTQALVSCIDQEISARKMTTLLLHHYVSLTVKKS